MSSNSDEREAVIAAFAALDAAFDGVAALPLEALTHPELLTVLPGRDHLLHRLLAAVVHRQAADDRRHGHGHGLPADSKTRLAEGTSEVPSFCCHTLVFEHAVRSGPPRHQHPRAA